MVRFFKKLENTLSESDLEKQIKELETRIKALEQNNFNNFQKVGFVRFNPFSETGGNMSFVIALLDGLNNGFVITSLHSRGGTRTYAKPVEKAKSKYELSKDEERAILKAVQGFNELKK
jgi:hypothetical protein